MLRELAGAPSVETVPIGGGEESHLWHKADLKFGEGAATYVRPGNTRNKLKDDDEIRPGRHLDGFKRDAQEIASRCLEQMIAPEDKSVLGQPGQGDFPGMGQGGWFRWGSP